MSRTATRDSSTTERFLAEAGITAGMRVLEIGCGAGEVTRLLARRVGPSGSVLAIDNNAQALSGARSTLAALGIDNVQFVVADIATDNDALRTYPEASFDALVGRRVLMYLREPSTVLANLSRWLKADGLLIFEEADSSFTPGRTRPMPAHDQAQDWLRRMLIAEGADPSMGLKLPATLIGAGARLERIQGVAVIEGQGAQYPLATMLSLMTTRLLATGVATEAALLNLLTALDAEAADTTLTFVSGMSFCAWARKR